MAGFELNFPADIGDTVYYVDADAQMVYPMTVFQIKKNRHIGDFIFDLVMDGDTWDQKFTVSIKLSDFNRTGFLNPEDAERALIENTEQRNVYKTMLQVANRLKYQRDCYVFNETRKMMVPAKILNIDFTCAAGVFHLRDEVGQEYYFDPRDIGTHLCFKKAKNVQGDRQ